MARMKGFFELKNPSDLLKKLEHDFQLMRDHPSDVYSAFNFFVTAEHMLDWLFPGLRNKQRDAERDASVVLQVCSHVANGAKHFEVEATRHKSVRGTGRGGGLFSSNYFSPRYWSPHYWGGTKLVIRLSGDARTQLGDSIFALDLAEKVLEFWKTHRLLSGPAP